MGWTDNKNARDSYAIMLKQNREYNKIERERLSKIKDFSKGQKVKLTYKNHIYDEIVLRVNQKSYTISFGNDDIVKIHKEKLYGYPKSIIDSVTGDGRKYIGETVKLLKEDALDKED